MCVRAFRLRRRQWRGLYFKSPERISATSTNRPGYSFETSLRYVDASSAAAASYKSRSFARIFSALRASPSVIARAAAGADANAVRSAQVNAKRRATQATTPKEYGADERRRGLTRIPLSGDTVEPLTDHFGRQLVDARQVGAGQPQQREAFGRQRVEARHLA